ncbi:hypothetical protein EV182_006433 [Spiromyces aspiralis]|uniref:Uncharacterized protein n=1 Tax=Spiromyces aspiralis TaxID=68401 RepID=A0ACC1HCJ8_9FUNG|nr:hypothetical protein EV182_006433 [Spiromyces aspiralis]
MLAKQEARPKYEAPVLFAHEIIRELEALNAFVTPIMNKPKPQPKPEEETKAKADPDATESNAEAPASSEAKQEANGATDEMDVD